MQSSPVAVKTPALQYMRAILAWQTCPACHLQSTPWLQDAVASQCSQHTCLLTCKAVWCRSPEPWEDHMAGSRCTSSRPSASWRLTGKSAQIKIMKLNLSGTAAQSA